MSENQRNLWAKKLQIRELQSSLSLPFGTFVQNKIEKIKTVIRLFPEIRDKLWLKQ